MACTRRCSEKKKHYLISGPQKPQNKGLRAKGEVISMLSERLKGKRKDGSAWVAFEVAPAALKPNHRGAQAIRNYVVRKFYNFVTNLIIC